MMNSLRVDIIPRFLFLAAAVLCQALAAACTSVSDHSRTSSTLIRALGPLQESPDSGSILRLLLAEGQYPLSRHDSCKDVGTRPDDQTIGDYLAGFLAEQGDGTNSITADCPAKNAASYECEVYLKHADGDDQWAWGVSFEISKSAGAIVDGSVRCLGAG